MGILKMNTYKYLNGEKLASYLSVRINKVDDSKYVTYLSEIHTNKEVKLTFSFSSSFSDAQILKDNDVMRKFIECYGADGFSRF